MEMTNNAEENLDEYISVARREVAKDGPFAFTILWTLRSVPSPKCEVLFESLMDHPVEKISSIARRGLNELRGHSKNSGQQRTRQAEGFEEASVNRVVL